MGAFFCLVAFVVFILVIWAWIGDRRGKNPYDSRVFRAIDSVGTGIENFNHNLFGTPVQQLPQVPAPQVNITINDPVINVVNNYGQPQPSPIPLGLLARPEYEDDPVVNIKCGFCDNWTPQSNLHCLHCGRTTLR